MFLGTFLDFGERLISPCADVDAPGKDLSNNIAATHAQALRPFVRRRQ